MCIVNNSTWRIWHQPIRCAPYHPSSNRAVERFVQMFKRATKLERGKHSCYISDCSVQPRERKNKLEFGWGLWACCLCSLSATLLTEVWLSGFNGKSIWLVFRSWVQISAGFRIFFSLSQHKSICQTFSCRTASHPLLTASRTSSELFIVHTLRTHLDMLRPSSRWETGEV